MVVVVAAATDGAVSTCDPVLGGDVWVIAINISVNLVLPYFRDTRRTK